jgi:uncharacterized membrane protein
MTLFSPEDTWPLFALMMAGTALAIWMEQRFRWGAKISGPVIALLIAMVLSNAHVMPAEAPAYDFVGAWLVPIALPLLLFRADFRQIARATGRLMISLHIAVVGSLIGAIIAGAAFKRFLPESAKAAGIMAASYIGGMVNFIAVKESTQASGSLTTSLIVADNLVMAGFFIIILWIAGSPFFLKRYRHPHTEEANSAGASAAGAHWERKGISLLDVAVCLSVATSVVAVAMLAKKGLEAAWPAISNAHWIASTLRTMCTNRFVLITAASLATATIFSRFLSRVNGADELGSFMLYLFLFGVGLPADLGAVLKGGPILFVFCLIIAVSNLGACLLFGWLLRQPIEELMIGVNATLGGPPTAAAMAISKNWSRLVLPGLLAGLWGYTIGTPLGLFVTAILEK